MPKYAVGDEVWYAEVQRDGSVSGPELRTVTGVHELYLTPRYELEHGGASRFPSFERFLYPTREAALLAVAAEFDEEAEEAREQAAKYRAMVNANPPLARDEG